MPLFSVRFALMMPSVASVREARFSAESIGEPVGTKRLREILKIREMVANNLVQFHVHTSEARFT